MSFEDWNIAARNFGYLDEHDMLHTMYVKEGLSLSEIALRLSKSIFTINRHMNSCGIEKRKRGGDNSNPDQTIKLFHLDQRVVLFLNLAKLAEVTGISRSLCYKYQRVMTGGDPDGVLHNLAGSRIREVLDDESSPPSSSTT